MAVNSRHNIYTSIPDWFSQSNSKTATTTPQQTVKQVIYTGGQSVPTSSGISEINLFNKFVIVETQQDITILTNTGTALIAVKTDEEKVGELVTAKGWATSDYLSIAAGTILQITATAHDNYGVVFYDNTQTVIQGNTVDPLGSELTVPANARYFRVCSTVDDETFSLIYNISKSYSKEQLLASDSNILDYTQLNPNIPEGIESINFNNSALKLLVQKPLQLNKDVNNVIKLSLDAETAGIGGAFWEIKVDENTKQEYIFTKYPVATQYGITMYTDEGNLVLPDIYAGLPHDNTIVRKADGTFSIPIDNSTIVVNNGKLTALGGTTGGAASEVAWANVKGKPSWLEDDVIKFNEVVGLSDKLDEYVTLQWDEDIEGVKDFLNGIKIDGIPISKYQDDVLYINSNLIVRGSITMYADDTVDIPSLMESIQTDGTTIINDNGTLKLNPDLELGGGGISSLTIKVGQDSYSGIGTEDVTVVLPGFIKSSEFSNLVQNEMNNYVSDKYVTRTGDEDITGVHPFVNGLKIGTSLINQSQEDVIFIDANVVVRGGITMYADNGTLDIPGIYDAFPHDATIVKTDGVFGIPIDNETIVLDNGKLTVVGGGTSGGAASEIAWVNIKGKPTWLEDGVVNITDVAGLPIELQKYAKLEDLNAYLPLTGGTVEYLNINTDLKIGDILLQKKSDSVLYLDGNLVVKGGITMYGDDSMTVPTIMDMIQVDGTTISKDKGYLEVIGGTGGGITEIATLSWSGYSSGSYDGTSAKTINIPNNNNQLTNGAGYITSSALNGYAKSSTTLSGYGITNAYTKTEVTNLLADYLSLSGGTIEGNLRLREGTSYTSPYLYFGDGSEVYLAELKDTHLTIHADGNILLTADQVTLNGTALATMDDIPTIPDIPDELPNPYALSWSGYSSGSYDGSATKSITIPNNTNQLTNGAGFITGISKSDVTSALGYTPYNSTNPNGYITSSGSITGNAATATNATNATNASNVYTNTSSTNSVFPVVFASNYSKGNQTLFVDSASGAGYNPYSNTFTASYFKGDVNGNINIGGDTSYRIETFTNGLELNTYSLFRIMQSGTTRLYMDANGNFGIKTSSPSSALHVAGSISADSKIYVDDEVTIQGGTSNPYIHFVHGSKNWYLQCYNSSYMYMGAGSANSLRIDGSGNVLTPGGITMYSDLRKKTILNNVELSLEQIANAPIIEYYYNSDEQKITHVGSSAQYWAEINDWFCKEDNDGYYTMELQNLALASSISVARELVRYESNTDKQIRELKEKIIELENRLKQYEYGSNT